MVTENNPLSCYTSRRIDYSAKLSESLSHEGLSSKIVVDDQEDDYYEADGDDDDYEAGLTEDLGKFL